MTLDRAFATLVLSEPESAEADGVHPPLSGHAVYSWRSAEPVRYVPEVFEPTCSCGHVLGSHRRGPGLGCDVKACLCLEDGDTPPAPKR